MTIATVLLVIAFILFILAAIGIPSRIGLLPAGLALCVAAVLAPILT